jgi:hypothetical protein
MINIYLLAKKICIFVERNPVLMDFSIYINEKFMSTVLSYYTAEEVKKLEKNWII